MYLEYYKLKELPFKIGPHPRFLYPTEQHVEALAKCKLTVEERGGIAIVYGDIGMGKSTIARQLVDDLDDPNCTVGTIINPSLMTEKAFLKAIMQEFDVKSMRSYLDSLSAFKDFMVSSYQAGKNLVLIIDEAQMLTPKMLGVLHSLHNFESNTDKFLQMILVGQNNLRDHIERLPNFKSRVVRFARLHHLNAHDTKEMIAFRWHAASGGKSEHPFTEKALDAIFVASTGLPREINKLCHESLLTAYLQGVDAPGRQVQEVDEFMVAGAAKELLLNRDEEK